jgi:hypothetical protein
MRVSPKALPRLALRKIGIKNMLFIWRLVFVVLAVSKL